MSEQKNNQQAQPEQDLNQQRKVRREKLAALQEAGQDPSQLDKLKDVQLTNDSVSIPAPMIGSLTLTIVDREENRCVKMETTDSPLQATLWIQMLPVSAGGAKIRCTLKAELNMMLKMMIGKKLEKGIDNFADMLAQLPYQMM